MYLCDAIPFILGVRLVDAPAGVTQEEGLTGFFLLPSAVLALIFMARRILIHTFPSSTVKSNFVNPRINRSPLGGHDFSFFLIFIFTRKNLSSCDCTEIRTHVPTS